MFDQGPHTVLRRDGVCLILKTPEREMPQVEYWGRDFGVDAEESALAALDALGPGADFLRLMAAELLERKK